MPQVLKADIPCIVVLAFVARGGFALPVDTVFAHTTLFIFGFSLLLVFCFWNTSGTVAKISVYGTWIDNKHAFGSQVMPDNEAFIAVTFCAPRLTYLLNTLRFT